MQIPAELLPHERRELNKLRELALEVENLVLSMDAHGKAGRFGGELRRINLLLGQCRVMRPDEHREIEEEIALAMQLGLDPEDD